MRSASLILPTTFSVARSITLTSSPRLFPTYNRRFSEVALFWPAASTQARNVQPNAQKNLIRPMLVFLAQTNIRLTFSNLGTESSLLLHIKKPSTIGDSAHTEETGLAGNTTAQLQTGTGEGPFSNGVETAIRPLSV